MTDPPPGGPPPPPAAEARRGWMTDSAASLLIDRLVVWAAGAGLVVAIAIVLVTLLTDRPIPDIGLLLIPGMPILFAGQRWVIFLLNSRFPRPHGNWRSRWSAQVQAQRNPRTFLFGSLRNTYAFGLIAVIVLGWLAAMLSYPGLLQGNPVDPMPGCPWPLMNHGFVTCASQSRYLDAGASGETVCRGHPDVLLRNPFRGCLFRVGTAWRCKGPEGRTLAQ
jgi:hypothetical protein